MVVLTLLFDIAVRDKRTDSIDNMMQCSPTNGLRTGATNIDYRSLSKGIDRPPVKSPTKGKKRRSAS